MSDGMFVVDGQALTGCLHRTRFLRAPVTAQAGEGIAALVAPAIAQSVTTVPVASDVPAVAGALAEANRTELNLPTNISEREVIGRILDELGELKARTPDGADPRASSRRDAAVETAGLESILQLLTKVCEQGPAINREVSKVSSPHTRCLCDKAPRTLVHGCSF